MGRQAAAAGCCCRLGEQLFVFCLPGGAGPETRTFLVHGSCPTRQPEARNPNILCARPGTRHKKGPNPKARTRKTRTKPESAARRRPPPPENGVICPIMGLFAIFCYLNHILCCRRDIFHSTLCHTLKLIKFLKHLLPIHRVNILVHYMAFVDK